MISTPDTADANKSKSIILVLTHSCNLNCVYCYEHHKDGRSMDLATAKDIIDREMASTDGRRLEIEFFGGEPLLEFEKIVALHDYLSSRAWPKEWVTTMTTNGTLAHGAIKEWLRRHQDTVKVALSADGTPQMHDENRCGSYDQIDFDFFAKTTSVAKMTISAQTLPNLARGIMHLHELGFETVRANLAFGIDWSNSENTCTFASELQKLADYYVDNPHLRPSDILNLPIEGIDHRAREYTSRHCGAGVELVAYEIDGTAYPCHTFSPVSAGEDIASKARNLAFEDLVRIGDLDEKCRDCPVANVCPNCYGINFSSTGNMYSKDDGYCRMTKVQFLANAYFKYMQYASGQLELTPEIEYRLLNNIKLVQDLTI